MKAIKTDLPSHPEKLVKVIKWFFIRISNLSPPCQRFYSIELVRQYVSRGFSVKSRILVERIHLKAFFCDPYTFGARPITFYTSHTRAKPSTLWMIHICAVSTHKEHRLGCIFLAIKNAIVTTCEVECP